MPRQKLSEYRAKIILSQALSLPYQGWSVDTNQTLSDQLKDIDPSVAYVVKVDEGVKGRFKKGLVLLDVKGNELEQAAKNLSEKGYHLLIIEPMNEHQPDDERYLALISDRGGPILQYTSSGGVDIEEHAESIQKTKIDEQTDWPALAEATGIRAEQLQKLNEAFQKNYFVFLEINPYLSNADNLKILDAAVEVDDAAAFFVDHWALSDLRRRTSHTLSEQEKTVLELDAKSPASFKLDVLEPNGSIFLLLSGGGASVLVADEIYNQGYGEQLGNYGEYSGNPNTEETYIYTKAVLELLLNSSAAKKVLFICGAVANFTDIAKTFAGVIEAINEVAGGLSEQKVKVYVRRGGPNQETGLEQIKAVLDKHGLLGAVHDPSTSITAAVSEALQEIKK